MFFFRRRKAKSEMPEEQSIPEVAEKEKKEKASKDAGTAVLEKAEHSSGEEKVEIKSSGKVPAKAAAPAGDADASEGPVKVVIPASALEEDDEPKAQAGPKAQVDSKNQADHKGQADSKSQSPKPAAKVIAPASPKPAVPEEVVDSLLVPVKRDMPEDSALPDLAETLKIEPEKSGKNDAKAQSAAAKIDQAAGKAEAAAAKMSPDNTTAPAGKPAADAEKLALKAEAAAAKIELAAAKIEQSAAKAEQLAAKADAPASPQPEKPKDQKPAEPAKKAAEGEDKGNMFSSLFGKNEIVEETPRDRLIKSLPDTTIEEVLNEAEEVKGLMDEWFQNKAQSSGNLKQE